MAQRKHTVCSQCGHKGRYGYLEIMWRHLLDGPWHYVGGWLCGVCTRAQLDFIGQIGAEVIAWDG